MAWCFPGLIFIKPTASSLKVAG